MKTKQFINNFFVKLKYTLIMNLSTSQKVELLHSISEHITHTRYSPTPVGGIFKYTIDGKQKCFTITTPMEAAVFLRKHGFIKTYTQTKEGQVRMYSVSYLTLAGPNGAPVQTPIATTVRWEDFTFTPAQVQSLASWVELEAAQDETSWFSDAPVIDLFKKLKLAA